MKKISKRLISILLVICLCFSMAVVAVPTASAGIGTFVKQKAIELGMRFVCKASTELAAQCEDDDASIVVKSVINLLLSDGHGVTTSNIASMCTDILAQLDEIEEDVRVYTADISSAIDKQNLLVAETQYTKAWKEDVTDVLVEYGVESALDAYVKYFIAATLNTNEVTTTDLVYSTSLREYWEEHYHDDLTIYDFTDEKVAEYKLELEKEFIEIYDNINGLANKDSAYKNVLIFDSFSSAIERLTQNLIHDGTGTDPKDYSVIDWAATDAYYGLPTSSQQYEFVHSAATRQVMIINMMQMALNEYLAMQGEYLDSVCDAGWQTEQKLHRDDLVDNSSTYSQCKNKYQEIVNASLEESVKLMEKDIKLNTLAYTGQTNDLRFKLTDYMNPADATKVTLSVNDYASEYDYDDEIARTEADDAMKLGNTEVYSKHIPSEMTFYRVMSGDGKNEVYYILDPSQFSDADALDIYNFRERIKRYGPTGGSDSLYGDLYPVGLDYLNMIKSMSDGANSFSIPKGSEVTSEYESLIKVPSFSATSEFNLGKYLEGFLPVNQTGGNTYLLTSSYSNHFNTGGNTAEKFATIDYINTDTVVGNDYAIETETVSMDELSDNRHIYSAILTNDSDEYLQNVKGNIDDKAGTIGMFSVKPNGISIGLNSDYPCRAGDTVTLDFMFRDGGEHFDSLVMVRHNSEDTETVLLDYEDLVNSMVPDNAGTYSFDVVMPHSDVEFILKTKAEPNPPIPGTTEPSTTEPSTTVPSTTVPSTTEPSTTVPETDPALLTNADLRTYQRILGENGEISDKSQIAMGYGIVDNDTKTIKVFMANTADRMGVLMHQGVDGKKGVLKLQGDYPKYSKTSGELLKDKSFVEPDIYTDGNGCIFITHPEDGAEIPELTVEYTAKPVNDNTPVLYKLQVQVVDISVFTSGQIAGAQILHTLSKDDPDYNVVAQNDETTTQPENNTKPTGTPNPSDDKQSTTDEASKNTGTSNGTVQTGTVSCAVVLLITMLALTVGVFSYRRKEDTK